MIIQSLAHLYVYFIEPVGKILLVVLAVLLVLQLVNLLSGKDKKFPLVDTIIKTIFKTFFVLMAMLGRFGIWLFKFVFKVTRVFLDTVKDFFTSKI